MDELTGPVLGITFVLMAVFLPAAFLPGITGQLYRQFALVIAATAVISAVNALTLKPVQCSQYLKPQTGQAQRVLPRLQPRLRRASKTATPASSKCVVRHSGVMMVGVRRPDGGDLLGLRLDSRPASSRRRTRATRSSASSCRTPPRSSARARSRTGSTDPEGVPGVAHLVTIGGISLLDNSASLPNGAVIVYVIYEDFETRGKAGLHARSRSWARHAAGSQPSRTRSCSRSCRPPSRAWASRAASR